MNQQNGKNDETIHRLKFDNKSRPVHSFISDPHSCVVRRYVIGDYVHVLVIHENRRQTLLTIQIRNDTCTVEDILRQASIVFSTNTLVSLNTVPYICVHFIVELRPEVDSNPSREGPAMNSQANSSNNGSSSVSPTTDNENKKRASIKQEDGSEPLNRKRPRTRRNNHLADQGPYEALEWHTISSDDADTDEKKIDVFKAETSSSTIANPGETIQSIPPTAPVDTAAASTSRDDNDEKRVISLVCRGIIIGTYHFTPQEEVIISKSGIKMGVPPINDETKILSLLIRLNCVEKVQYMFEDGKDMMLFRVTGKTGVTLRKLLGMQTPQGPTYEPYFDPTSQSAVTKWIIILPAKMSFADKVNFKRLFLSNDMLSALNISKYYQILGSILLVDGWPRSVLSPKSDRLPVTQFAIKKEDESEDEVRIFGPELKTEIKREMPSCSTDRTFSHSPSPSLSSTGTSQMLESTDVDPSQDRYWNAWITH